MDARALKKNGKQSIGRTKGGLTTKIHMCCSSEKYPFIFSISAWNKNDAPEGRKLIDIIYSKDKNPLLHSVENSGMIVASYRGGARDHAEGYFKQKKNAMERQGRRKNDTYTALPF